MTTNTLYLIFSICKHTKKVLTRPTAGNSTFPYHVKTNQITIAKTDDDTQNFPHHEENKGGNIYFANDGLQITDLFSMPNHGEKYQVGDATSRRSVATTINSNDINETNQVFIRDLQFQQ